MSTDKYQIDMCRGPLFSKILLFALPLIMTGILQLLFNAVDLVVIGHYASHEAMAAIGATLNLNSLIVNLFIGLSIGSNVIAARSFGAGDKKGLDMAVHTSLAVAIYGGLILMVIGLLVAKPLLILMGTPDNILPLSCTYIWICFSGIPFIMIYNFGCALLRAIGDTRRPLYFLIIAGVVNVLMNLFLVICCGMNVGGVALATVLSHIISAALILWTLLRWAPSLQFSFRRIAVEWKTMREMLNIGIPAGLQSSCFGLSNMIIQSSINSFGSLAIAGSAACVALEGLVYISCFAFHQTAISFVAQNLGGGQIRRIRNTIFYCIASAIVISSAIGCGLLAVAKQALGLFNSEPDVIVWGIARMKVMFLTYGLCGIMDSISGALRGLGYSLISMVNSLFGACLMRAAWVIWVFPRLRSMEFLMLCYPISWLLVSALNGLILWLVYRKVAGGKTPGESLWARYSPGLARGMRFLLNSK